MRRGTCLCVLISLLHSRSSRRTSHLVTPEVHLFETLSSLGFRCLLLPLANCVTSRSQVLYKTRLVILCTLLKKLGRGRSYCVLST